MVSRLTLVVGAVAAAVLVADWFMALPHASGGPIRELWIMGFLAAQTGWASVWMVIGIDAWIIRALVALPMWLGWPPSC